ncbi:MAG: hypothetical protein E7633_02090 [Ruminococcaceae bacterium]|nr:hypothetical protein [Oscillospiraceae bacterium]
MLKKQSTIGILLAILLLVVAVSVISVVAKFNTDKDADVSETPADIVPEKNDSELLYEVYIDGRFTCMVNDVRDVFSASDKIESSMSEKLGHAYSISNDLVVEMIAVRKTGDTVSSNEVESLISREISKLYSKCYAFYVGDSIIGYSPVSEKEELESLAVDIIKYISASDKTHAAASNVYITLDYTYKSNIVTDTSEISAALSAQNAFESTENLDENIANLIESIDQAIMFGTTAEEVPDSITPEIVVTSIRRISTEVVPYEKIKVADTECVCAKCKTAIKLLADDKVEEGHQKGKNGKCTVEYEDIYIGDEFSHSVRIEESKIITTEPVDEITLVGTQSTKASGKMVWPTVGWITSYYGYRDAEFSGMSTYHRGLDISTRSGTAIVAADAGVVVEAGWHSGGYGYYVIIDHENGQKTLYAHMKKGTLCVKEGERVFQGQKLGGQGMTGSANGVHLHFEVYVNDKRVNPIKYMPTKRPNTAW